MWCPKCKAELQPAGTAEMEGESLVVYQCDTCTRPWHFDGGVFDVALTFAVDASGRLLDPETLEPISLN